MGGSGADPWVKALARVGLVRVARSRVGWLLRRLGLRRPAVPWPGYFKASESPLAHLILDGLRGLEIGAAAHNPFGLSTRNVGLSERIDPQDFQFFRDQQMQFCGAVAPIDIEADAAAIPAPDSSEDFVLHSHVWEHLPDPLGALLEWVRIVRAGGFLFVIVPKRDAADADKDRPITPLAEYVRYYEEGATHATRSAAEGMPIRGHYNVFSPDTLHAIAEWFNARSEKERLEEVAFLETDDKVGNGHTIVWRVWKSAG
jgi:SAM-dependent methyltransferase